MIAAIVQARMTSTRLPGKVLKEVRGKPLLSYLIERLRRVNNIEKIIIATTNNKEDDPIVELCKKEFVSYFRGSEDDVLDRYYQTAKKFGVEHVVRITSDCPLIDPCLIEELLNFYLRNPGFDLVKTGPAYSEGLDAEVFPFRNLQTVWKEARLSSEREHVTPFLWKNVNRFRIKTLPFENDYSFLRLTVDEAVDFEVIKAVLEEQLKKKGRIFLFKDILNLYREKPYIFEKNMHVIRNEGYLKSLKNDRILDKRMHEIDS